MALVNFLKDFYTKIIRLGDGLQSLFLLATRLTWGLLFYFTGSGKLADIKPVIGFFQSLHIPFPDFSAHLVGWTEMICGACLIVGFATRLVCIPLLLVILTALLTAEYDAVRTIASDLSPFLRSSPFSFLYALLVIFIFGPGKISLDYILEQLIGSGRGK